MNYITKIIRGFQSRKRDTAKLPAFFVTGCARSGTTSLCKILNNATNGVCLLEPVPNLNVESRDLIDGKLANPLKVIREIILPRVTEKTHTGRLYGEKNVTLVPFLPYLNELFNAKFVIVQRDGRDVTTSLMNWHNEVFGSIYRECKDPGNLSETAKNAVANLPLEQDISDYSRPRPHPGDPWYDKWPDLSRFEMCAWYWAHTIRLTQDMLNQIDQSKWMIIDYTNPTVQKIKEIYDFLELSGFDSTSTQNMLNNRINSVKERTGISQRFPNWQDWEINLQNKFFRIAGKEMYDCGYLMRPPEFGQWWQNNDKGTVWYEWMHNGRKAAHEHFVNWFNSMQQSEHSIQSILEVGCGRGIFYPQFFKDYYYDGIDLSNKEIDYCKSHDANPKHGYYCIDVLTQNHNIDSSYDLVFSQGTIDNAFDMDKFIRVLASKTNRFLFITAYRGYFPELNEHEYYWSDVHQCCYNNISPRKVKNILSECGFRYIKIYALPTDVDDYPYETVILAEK